MPRLLELLVFLGEHWTVDGLVHGDFKWENCLVVEHGELRIVDWELVDAGDTAWDLATIFKEYLFVSLFLPPGRAVDHGALQSAIRAFCLAWAEARFGAGGPMTVDPRPTFARAIGYTAARLVTASLEYVQFVGRFDANVARLLELAQAMLSQPDAACVGLFGPS
jgi:hypothetical protein